MMNLIIKDILENSNKIDRITKCVSKTNILCAIGFLTTSFGLKSLIKMIDKQEKKINELESKLEEIQLKGE